MKTYKTIINWLLFVALFCLLRYVAGFSVVQSGLLSFALFGLYAMIYSLRGAKVPFVPYSVVVIPNLHAILTDFDFVKGTEEWWAELNAGLAELPQAALNIWKSGFSFSFITPELVYNNACNSFVTEVAGYASLEPVAIRRSGEVVIQRKDKRDSMRLRRTTWDENGVRSIEETGQSVVQAIVARRLLGGRY